MDENFEALTAHKEEIFHKLADPLFYVGLALVLLIYIAAYINRRAPKPGPFSGPRAVIFATAFLGILLAAYCQSGIDTQRGFIVDQQRRQDLKFREIAAKEGKEAALKMQYMYLPTANFLTATTLNNPSLGADYVWLMSLQYVSNAFRRGDKFELLAHFYRTMVDLDPHWVDAECTGGKVLSALIEEREKAEKAFLYAEVQNPDSWRILHELGLLYVMPPRDPKQMREFSRRAALYFAATREHRKCPKELYKTLDDRVARLSLESGVELQYYMQAEALLYKNATDPESTDQLRDISKRDWLRAHSMAQAAALTEMAGEIKKVTGAFPKTLKEIVAKMPKPEAFASDAYKQPFDYDAATGTVTSHGANAYRSIQASDIVNQTINYFRDHHQGRAPKDLVELRDFIRTAKFPPFDPPNVMLLEAIGIELDPTTGPLGPWKYDAAKGIVIKPPEANATELYSHVKDYFKD